MATENAHVLIPEELAPTLPPLYATQNEADPLARVKLFTPDSSWTWYVVEYDAGCPLSKHRSRPPSSGLSPPAFHKDLRRVARNQLL